MSLETSGSETASESVSSETPAVESNSGSGYSVTDPGYESFENESEVDALASLKAENTTKKPSETSDDAGSDTEETAETPADDAADSDGISDELLDRAFELGYTLDELKAFDSQQSLEKEVARVEKIQKRLQERQGKKPETEDSAPADEADPEPKWDELIELGHDPDMIALQKQNWQRAQKAEAMVQQLLRTEQERALTAQAERFDETLNKLKGFETILGTGRKSELGQTEAANRQTVYTTMEILRRGYEAAGVKVPAEAELIQAAAMASFPKHTDQIARTKLKGDIQRAGSQALSRPRSAGGKPLAGQALAAAKEAEFWKKHS